jgi:hypothetical protein
LGICKHGTFAQDGQETDDIKLQGAQIEVAIFVRLEPVHSDTGQARQAMRIRAILEEDSESNGAGEKHGSKMRCTIVAGHLYTKVDYCTPEAGKAGDDAWVLSRRV